MATKLLEMLISAEGMSVGSSGEEIKVVQNYLEHYGYTNLPTVGLMHEGDFDESLESAVKQYQKFFSLPESGILDDVTLQEMTKPRCGFPDFPTKGDKFANFGVASKWQHNPVTYSIENFSPQMPRNLIDSSIRNAFELWARNCGLNFQKVTNGGDILIGFGRGLHGNCPEPFDGKFGTFAHAFFPPPAGGFLPGDCHFDEDEQWSANTPTPNGYLDFETVAAHEFGHSIGLTHSGVRDALMFPSYSGPRRYLSQDDIQGAQYLYGP